MVVIFMKYKIKINYLKYDKYLSESGNKMTIHIERIFVPVSVKSLNPRYQ